MFAPRDVAATTGSVRRRRGGRQPGVRRRRARRDLARLPQRVPAPRGVIVWPGSGTAGNLVCRYHGWAFDWDGKLKAARDFGDEAGLCPDDRALAPISVRLLAQPRVRPPRRPPPPFDEAIAPFDAECDAFAVESFGYVRRVERKLACNWKTYADNYLEGYHVSLLHPSLSRALDMSTYRVDVPRRLVLHPSCRDCGGFAGGWGVAVPLPEPGRQHLRRRDERRTHRARRAGADPGGRTTTSPLRRTRRRSSGWSRCPTSCSTRTRRSVRRYSATSTRDGTSRGRSARGHERAVHWFQSRRGPRRRVGSHPRRVCGADGDGRKPSGGHETLGWGSVGGR